MKATIVRFKEAKAFIPSDAMLIRYDRGQRDEENFLIVEGDLSVDNLNLDEILADLAATLKLDSTAMLGGIIVTGNLTAANIFNWETDGSGSLIVKGNVTTGNMVVGGQEIFITGNLSVKDLFWGDYNHGELTVKGTTHTRVFMATNEYHYEYDKSRIQASWFLCDDDENETDFDEEKVEHVFIHGMMLEEDEIDDDEEISGWKDLVSRYKVIRRLEENRSAIRSEFDARTDAEKEKELLGAAPVLFSDSSFDDQETFEEQADNFQQLIAIAATHPEHTQQFECNGFEIHIHRRIADAEEDFQKNDYVLAMRPDGLQFFIQLEKNADRSVKLLAKNKLIILYRLHEEKAFENIFGGASKTIVETAQTLWSSMLYCAEKGHYIHGLLQQEITPDKLITLLELPIVTEEYNDYLDPEKNGFWYRNFFLGFRQHGANDEPASFDIGMEIPDDEFDMRKYLIRPNSISEPQFVELFYTSSQDGKTTDRYSGENYYKIYLYDWPLLLEVMKWFPRAVKYLQQENDSFLE